MADQQYLTITVRDGLLVGRYGYRKGRGIWYTKHPQGRLVRDAWYRRYKRRMQGVGRKVSPSTSRFIRRWGR